jgi:hypothetical protein
LNLHTVVAAGYPASSRTEPGGGLAGLAPSPSGSYLEPVLHKVTNKKKVKKETMSHVKQNKNGYTKGCSSGTDPDYSVSRAQSFQMRDCKDMCR